MKLYGTEWHSWYGYGNQYYTAEVNIPPAWVGAQVSLYGHTGGGTSYTGIKQYRRRLSNGKDKVYDFGEWPSWPPVIFDYVSSITFAIATGEDQWGWLIARMDYWA